MYPHERSLVERLANRPFAIIGINSDRPSVTARIIASGIDGFMTIAVHF